MQHLEQLANLNFTLGYRNTALASFLTNNPKVTNHRASDQIPRQTNLSRTPHGCPPQQFSSSWSSYRRAWMLQEVKRSGIQWPRTKDLH